MRPCPCTCGQSLAGPRQRPAPPCPPPLVPPSPRMTQVPAGPGHTRPGAETHTHHTCVSFNRPALKITFLLVGYLHSDYLECQAASISILGRSLCIHVSHHSQNILFTLSLIGETKAETRAFFLSSYHRIPSEKTDNKEVRSLTLTCLGN